MVDTIIGKIFGKLSPVRATGKTKNSQFYFECSCDCGNKKVVRADRFRSGEVTHCGCIPRVWKTGPDSPNYKHGKSRTVLYDLWNDIKVRCNCEKVGTNNYKNYKSKGITFDTSFENFEVFASELGEPPFKGATVDRIDNTKNYEPGNLRWATMKQQSRNRGKTKCNTSGETGVGFDYSGNPNHTTYVYSTWVNLDGVSGKKKFSVNKLGLFPAFKAAVEYRRNKIAELNTQGAGYTENHGK